MNCPECNHSLLRLRADHIALILNRIIVKAEGAGAFVVCPKCKAEMRMSEEITEKLRGATLLMKGMS